MWTSINAYSNELYAQRSPFVPTSINQGSVITDEDSSVCLDYETRTSSNTCEPDFEIKPEQEPERNFSSVNDQSTNENGEQEQISLLPNPEVDFVEEYMVKFDSKKSRDTIFYGGVVPFVALPDGELANQDSFFNEDSFSVFFYLKRKF